MKKRLLFGATVLAMAVTAACNRSEDKAADAGNAVQPTSNATATTGAPLDPQAAYKARHDGFEGMGRSMKAINRELKGGSPDVAVLQREAASLADTAPQIANWFPAGSGQDVNTRSRAKNEIWTNNQDFQQRTQNFVQAANAFRQTAQGGDAAAIQGALPSLGNSCKECHDRYRAEER